MNVLRWQLPQDDPRESSISVLAEFTILPKYLCMVGLSARLYATCVYVSNGLLRLTPSHKMNHGRRTPGVTSWHWLAASSIDKWNEQGHE